VTSTALAKAIQVFFDNNVNLVDGQLQSELSWAELD
jgi:hypothetical protein